MEPHFIRYVADREGTVREEAAPKLIEALRADVAYVMTYLLEGVTESGTGAAAQALSRVVAGKTGTTEDYADAWFVGFSPSLVAGVWAWQQKLVIGDFERYVEQCRNERSEEDISPGVRGDGDGNA